MNDLLLIQLNKNKQLVYDYLFCQRLASALHTHYIKAKNFELDLIKILGKSKLRNDIILMPKQIEILNEIDKYSKIVISAPTSFGKSFLMLEYVKRLEKPLHLIVYIVHTKALLDEIYNNFFENFGKQYNVVDDFDDIIDESNNIVVIISDGKNIYDFNENIDLLIVDEAYNLDKRHSGDRFLTIYNCYKILLSCSDKIILLGPFIKNLIGPESKDYKLCKTNYSPVTSILYECDSLIWDNASDAFLHCIQNKENTIGFINSKTLIYDEMANILENGNLADIYNDDFIEWMESYFPDFWMLPKLMKKGIAIYHSSFPKYINLYNLKMFNEGIFKGLLTTSAILEGVNTSAKNIVVYGTTYNNEKLTPFQFFNLCGRAGRLNKEIVGLIFNFGDSYNLLYKQRCLSLFIGDSPETPEDKFDEGFFDESTEFVENKVREELSHIGISYDEWYNEFKFYFSKCTNLLNLIEYYKVFRENFKTAIYSILLKKSGKGLNKNEVITFIYNKFINLLPNFKYNPRSQFYVVFALQALLASSNNGINFNLKSISESTQIKRGLDHISEITKKNQYIVEIMRTGYEYIPYRLYYVSLLLNEFIKHDAFFSDNEKQQFYDYYYKRILVYLKKSDGETISKILSDKGMLPPTIKKVIDYISNNNIEINNKTKKELLNMVRAIIKKINLDKYELINLYSIHIN